MTSLLKVDEIQDAAGKKILQNTGGILQVKQVTNETSKSTSSTSFASTGISVDITPTSSSSKILVTFAAAGVRKSTDNTVWFSLYRDGSSIAALVEGLFDTSSTIQQTGSVTSVYLDSPATTEEQTYEIYWKAGNSNTVSLNVANWGVTSLTVQEISA